MLIRSSFVTSGHTMREYSTSEIKDEPMLFNCDLSYAKQIGGPITKEFIAIFQKETSINDKDAVIDTRVHMLMPNWYPCIPGYHHDDVPRPNNGQPDYINPSYRSQHCLALVNADVCPTEFAVGSAVFELPEENEIIYKKWHNDVMRYIKEGKLKVHKAPDRKLIYFNDRTWHQGTAAVKNGWRWFGRISWNTDRVKTVTNEIRKQVQVYLDNLTEGW